MGTAGARRPLGRLDPNSPIPSSPKPDKTAALSGGGSQQAGLGQRSPFPARHADALWRHFDATETWTTLRGATLENVFEDVAEGGTPPPPQPSVPFSSPLTPDLGPGAAQVAARLEDAGEHRTPPLPSPPVAGHASLRSWMAAAGLSDASSPAQRHLATLWAAAKEAPRLARLHEAVRASELVIAEREAAESERRIAAMAKRAGALEADNARLRDALAAACGREEEARQEAGRAAGRLDSVRRRAEAMAAALEAAGVESGGPGLEARLERAVEGLVALEMRSAGVGELESEAEGEAGELESLGGRLEGALWAAREEVLRLSASLRAAEHAREVAAGQKRALEEELAEAVEEARRRGAEGREAAAALEEARRRLGSLDAAGLAAEQAAAAVEEALRRENEALQREVEEAREGERRREAEVAELEQRWRALGEELECKESRLVEAESTLLEAVDMAEAAARGQEEARRELVDALGKLGGMDEAHQAACKQAEMLRAACAELSRRAQAATQPGTPSGTAMETLRWRIKDLEEQLEVAVAELGRSQEALEQARGSAAELGSEKRRLEEALEERAVREREMEARPGEGAPAEGGTPKSALRGQLEGALREMEAMEGRHREAQEEIETLREQLRTSNALALDAARALEEVQRGVEEAEGALEGEAEARREARAARAEANRHARAARESREALEQAREGAAAARDMAEALGAELEVAREDASRSREAARQSREEARALGAELEAERGQRCEAEGRAREAEDATRRLRRQLEAAGAAREKAVDQLAGRMRDAEAELVAARGAADEAHRRMSALAEEAEALRAENEALLAELEGAREAARALKMEHEEAVEELRLLRTSKRSRAGSMCGEDFEGQGHQQGVATSIAALEARLAAAASVDVQEGLQGEIRMLRHDLDRTRGALEHAAKVISRPPSVHESDAQPRCHLCNSRPSTPSRQRQTSAVEAAVQCAGVSPRSSAAFVQTSPTKQRSSEGSPSFVSSPDTPIFRSRAGLLDEKELLRKARALQIRLSPYLRR